MWLAFISIFIFAFLGPLFNGNEVEFTTNGVPTVAGPGNLYPVLLPAIILLVFVIVGFAVLGSGIYMLVKRGGYFVGTPTRLVHYRNGNIRSIDWEQFIGDIEVNGDTQKGNISLQLRSGHMVSQKNSSDRYIPDIV